MSKSYIPYLQHILEECRYVRSVVPDDAKMYEFLSDETLKRAVTRSLEMNVAKNIIPTLIPQIEEIIAVGEDEVKE